MAQAYGRRRATASNPAGGSARRASAKGGAPAQERELRAQGRKTMRKLLDASVTVFDKRGYHSARVDDIVKVAKTSHGTFYLYFANKEDLFRALVSDVAREMMAVAESLGPIGPDAAGFKELREWLVRFDDIYWRYGAVIRAWTEAAATEDGEFGLLGARVTSAFGKTLGRRIAEDKLAPGVDPEVATLALVAMVERYHYYLLVARGELDRGAVAETLATMAHQGLFGRRTRH